MSTITIGKRIIPLAQIVLIEAFDRTANPRFQSDKPYKSRLILVDRTSILSESDHATLATEHGFRVLPGDDVATNPVVRYAVESFEPSDEFQPSKPFRSRLLWRDGAATHSKLLLGEPHSVLAFVAQDQSLAREQRRAPGSKTRRRRAAKAEPKPEPA